MSEPDVSALISVARAVEIIDALPVTPRTVRVPLSQSRGLRLAEDLRADRDYPPFDRSLMDGYAVRSADVTRTPVELRVVGEVAAGAQASRPLAAGEAMAIMTGAPLPPGADGVVPVEDTSPAAGTVRINSAKDPARFITRRGADAPAGRVVLEKGMLMDAAQIATAATIGAAEVNVFARPRAAVLATGDELVPIEQTPGGSKIRNSNSPMLAALLAKFGCEVTDLGVAPDDPAAIRAKIEQGLTYDVLLITGGMSMGAYDYVPKLLLEMGVKLHITKLRIKPGKPFVCGTASSGTGGSPVNPFVFGLPGNPVSSFACTIRLVSRLVTRLAGGVPIERWLTGALAAPLPASGPREFYQPVRLDRSPGGVRVHPMEWKGSADLFTLARADALLVRPENDGARNTGDTVTLLEI